MYSDMEDLEPPPRRPQHGFAPHPEGRMDMGGFPGAGQGRRVIYPELSDH